MKSILNKAATSSSKKTVNCNKIGAEIWFVRHGETTANRESLLQGHCDYPLTEKGLKQCVDVGSALQSMQWSKVFSSDLPRTLHTSEILLSKSSMFNPNGPLKLRIESLLREMNFGVKEKLPGHISVEEATQIVALQKGIPFDAVVNDAETYDDVKERQHIFITRVLYQELLLLQNVERNSHEKTSSNILCKETLYALDSDVKPIYTAKNGYPKILCVTHGGFIKEFLSNFCDMRYVPRPYDGSYIASMLEFFGRQYLKRIRLSNCSITIVTIEWNLDGDKNNFLCKTTNDDINIINHIQC